MKLNDCLHGYDKFIIFGLFDQKRSYLVALSNEAVERHLCENLAMCSVADDLVPLILIGLY